ncbi:MAG: hypothetical protein ACKOIA_05445 [Acidimicrobiia bacterium]
MRIGVVIAALLVVGLVAFVVAARRRRPETVWNPGLEFDPDFDLTLEEIEADRRGESPSA